LSRIESWAFVVWRASVIVETLAAVAVGGAVLASRFFPTGLARTAEPAPGFDADVAVLALGAAAIAFAVVVLAAWPAWRAARVSSHDATPPRLSLASRVLGNRSAPLPVSAGMRLALDPGRGGNATAVRSSLAAVTLGVATLVAAITFGAGLSHLLETPALYGKSWDVALTTYDASLPKDGVRVLAADHRVEGVAVGRLRAAFTINGLRVDGLAVDTVSGRLDPVILAGRPPKGPDEIALGTRTMRALHLHLGDSVAAGQFSSPAPARQLHVVGRAVFPLFGELGRLGDGAFVTRAAWAEVQDAKVDPASEAVLVRLTPGADRDAVIRDLVHGMGDPSYGVAVISQGKPTDIVNFGRVQGTPYLLGAVLALLSIVTLTYLLLSALRRRRRDLAILKTLGFVRGQVRAMVACQATTLVVVALLIGMPLGIVIGRGLWIRFADDLGIVAVPVVPVVTLAIAALVAVVAGNLVAAVPATLAARTKPAQVLRSE
jgi:ABC-type lipoprotein release transport system permease subunit